jgi:N-carbamoylputrescine amidase
MSRPVTLALVQSLGRNAQPDRFAALLASIRRGADQGAQVVILPELFLNDYFCIEESQAHFDLAHGPDNAPMEALRALAAERKLALVAPYYERRAAGVYFNSLIVFDADGSTAGHYRKMHIPDDPGFSEKYYFAPGDTGFQCISTRHVKLGPLICWDQWYPEAARLTALLGAELLVYPTAIGWDDHELAARSSVEAERLRANQCDAWVTIQRSHAIANGVYVAAVNRVGREGHLQFWGNSFLASPEGEILARLGTEPGLLVHTVDLDAIEQTRRVWPFLRDRRIDAFEGLTRRYLG